MGLNEPRVQAPLRLLSSAYLGIATGRLNGTA
jgi:hypothetical protein